MSSTSTDTGHAGHPPSPSSRSATASSRTWPSAAGVLILVVLAGVAVFLLAEAVPAIWRPRRSCRRGTASSPTSPRCSSAPCSPRSSRCWSPPRSRSASRCSSPTTRRAGSPSRSATSSTCSPRCPASSTGSGASAVLGPASVGRSTWLNDNLGCLPFFAGPVSATGRTMLTAGLVLAVMILPIITAISREVFAQTPTLHEEAALALGATRWEMIRMAVLPFGRSGVIAARCSAWAARSARRWPWPWCCRRPAPSRST